MGLQSSNGGLVSPDVKTKLETTPAIDALREALQASLADEAALETAIAEGRSKAVLQASQIQLLKRHTDLLLLKLSSPPAGLDGQHVAVQETDPCGGERGCKDDCVGNALSAESSLRSPSAG